MTKFSEALLDSMLQLILNRGNPDAVRVTAYAEVEKSSGYCETCYWKYTEVEITYVTGSGESKVYTYHGDFGELIRDLTDET